MSKRFERTGGWTATGASNLQSVFDDGTYIYISEGESVLKYTREGALLISHDTTPDGDNHHLGGLYVYEDILYVTSCDIGGGPLHLIVKKYNTSDLSYIGQVDTGRDHVAEDLELVDGRWWLLLDDEHRRLLTTDFAFGDQSYMAIPSATEPMSGNNNGWNGMVKVGDEVYLNTHGGTYPDHVQHYRYNEALNNLTWIEEIERPVPREWNGQGMDYIPDLDLFVFAGRTQNADPDSITFARLVDVDPVLSSSDYDAFKNSGAIQTRTINIADTLAGGEAYEKRAQPVIVDNPDILVVLYDNSVYHSGKYKPVSTDEGTGMPDDTTIGGNGSGSVFIEIDGNEVTVGFRTFNPYAAALVIGPVSYHFRFIPYETTI